MITKNDTKKVHDEYTQVFNQLESTKNDIKSYKRFYNAQYNLYQESQSRCNGIQNEINQINADTRQKQTENENLEQKLESKKSLLDFIYNKLPHYSEWGPSQNNLIGESTEQQNNTAFNTNEGGGRE
jgi:chromosome segregation ATPase